MIYLGSMKLTLTATGCVWYELAKNSNKKEARLLNWRRIEKYVQGRYNDFDHTITNFTAAPPISKNLKIGGLLRAFYLAPPKDVKEVLRVRRRDHNLLECPSCGYPTEPDTLDHFLPKEDWPEYAIFPNNLVPQCRGCAPVKGQRYYGTTENSALFLNPIYSDAISSVQFKIDVILEKGRPKFSIGFSIGCHVSSQDKERVIVHLQKLNVKERIRVFCYRHYSHWKQMRSQQGLNIPVAFTAALGPKQVNEQEGRNWAVAFMQGVLRNPAVVADLQSVSQPTSMAPSIQRVTLNV